MDRTALSSLYQIAAKINAALDRRLPGADAHLALAPRPRHGWRPGMLPAEARVAAGLILLYPSASSGGTVQIVLTLRAETLGFHAGQVSLPGGAVEAGEGIPETALREAAEEIGLDPAHVSILGRLSHLYIPASDSVLHPVVGIARRRPAFRPSLDEVGRIIEVPVANLVADGPHRGYRWRDGQRVDIPYFELGGERVWGATAMVLSELRAAMGAPAADPWSAARPNATRKPHPHGQA